MQSFKKFNPQGESCIVLPYETPKISETGIVYSHDNNTSNAKVRGTVLEASEKSVYKDKVGSIVLFRRYSTDEYKWIDEKGEQIVYQVDDCDIRCLPEL